MTNEEQAVIEAAVKWAKTIHHVLRVVSVTTSPNIKVDFGRPQPEAVHLWEAVNALTASRIDGAA